MRRGKKLDDKGEICICLGINDQSKAYKLYNLSIKKIIISHDIFFIKNELGFGTRMVLKNVFQ